MLMKRRKQRENKEPYIVTTRTLHYTINSKLSNAHTSGMRVKSVHHLEYSRR